MEFWTEVRRRVLTGQLSKRAACREYELSWHTVAEISHPRRATGLSTAEASEEAEARFLSAGDSPDSPKTTGGLRRSNATRRERLFERLVEEHEYAGCYTIVKDAVRAWKHKNKEVFFPLSHLPGEAQVDFGEATVKLVGQPRMVALFVMTLPYSGAIFVQAFPRECTETFLEGHRRAFEFFGGVPTRISYDNTSIAVTKVLRGRDRKLTKEFLRLQSCYLFQEHFCLVRRPNEKGHVERLLGYGRRNFLVPVPEVTSLESLNASLRERCVGDQQHRTRGKSGTKEELLVEDQAAFLPLPKQPFEARRIDQVSADSQSLIRFDSNSYSVPVKYAHRKLTVVATVSEVRLIYEDQLVAWHPRCWEKEQFVYEPVHYLALLERKPGGFDHARPLENWDLPDCFALLRRRLEADDGGRGTRQFIRVLRLLERFTLRQLADAVQYALDLDVIDPDSKAGAELLFDVIATAYERGQRPRHHEPDKFSSNSPRR